MSKNFTAKEIAELGVKPKKGGTMKNKVKNINYQGYIALLIVGAVIVGLGVFIRSEQVSFTLEWPYLATLLVAVGAWTLKTLAKNLR